MIDKAAPLDAPEDQTGNSGKCTAYPISVHRKPEALHVYAVPAPSAGAALTQMGDLTTDDMKVEVVGAFSRDLTWSLDLKPSEMQII